jgi:hypothetical protein
MLHKTLFNNNKIHKNVKELIEQINKYLNKKIYTESEMVLISNFWNIIELLFRNNFESLKDSVDIKKLIDVCREGFCIAIPYSELFLKQEYIDFILHEFIENKPYFDDSCGCFVFSNAIDLFYGSMNILDEINRNVTDDEVIYKHFVFTKIIKKIEERKNKSRKNETSIDDLINACSFMKI